MVVVVLVVVVLVVVDFVVVVLVVVGVPGWTWTVVEGECVTVQSSQTVSEL